MANSVKVDSQSEHGKSDRALKEPKLSRVPNAELKAYAAVSAAVLLYFGYDFYKAYGADKEAVLPFHMLRRGWMMKYRDSSNDFMYAMLRDKWLFLTVTSCGYLVVSRLTLRFASATCHHLACAAYTACLTGAVLNWRTVAYILTLHALTVAAARLSLLAVWAVVLSAMIAQNRRGVDWRLELNPFQLSLFYPMMGYLYCRLISMGHCVSAGGSRKLSLGLHYVLYLPYHYVGPIVTFDDFCRQVGADSRSLTRARVTGLLWSCARLVLWLLVLEAVMHLLPVNAFFAQITDAVPYSHLVFAMYAHGQSFMLIYLQLYGWGTLVAAADGIRLPDWPACISRVYTYSEMWRVFDRGLFAVMHSHVYIPLGGSRRGPLWQAVAVAASFAFVSVYHGDSTGIRLWVALNAAQVLAERLLVWFYWRRLHGALGKFMHPGLQSRLVTFVISWNLIFSCCTIFFFFLEDQANLIAAEMLIKPLTFRRPFYPLLALVGTAYCFAQLGMAYKQQERERRRR